MREGKNVMRISFTEGQDPSAVGDRFEDFFNNYFKDTN